MTNRPEKKNDSGGISFIGVLLPKNLSQKTILDGSNLIFRHQLSHINDFFNTWGKNFLTGKLWPDGYIRAMTEQNPPILPHAILDNRGLFGSGLFAVDRLHNRLQDGLHKDQESVR